MNNLKKRKRDINQAGFSVAGILFLFFVLSGLGGLGPLISLGFGQEGSGGTVTAQNDNAVRNDMSWIMVELNTYAGNNNGQYPSEPAELEDFQDSLTSLDPHPVSGLPYTVDEAKATTHEYITYTNGVCSDDGTIQLSDNPRRIALSTELPSGQMHCIDNS